MKPFVHSGNSANLAYYGERGPQTPERIWCEVLRSDFDFRRTEEGERVAATKPVPDFHITVYRQHSGSQLARFTYTPRSRPKPGPLPARTVARLVREALS